MKKILLLLTLLVTATASLHAADKSYTITFTCTKDDNKTVTSAAITKECATYLDQSSPISSDNVYLSDNSIRIGTSENPGEITLKLSETGKVTAKKIVISAKKYVTSGGNADSNANMEVCGKSFTVNTTSFADYTAEFDPPKDLTEISLKTTNSSGRHRVIVKSISVYYDDSFGDITAKLNGTETITGTDKTITTSDFITFSAKNATSITAEGTLDGAGSTKATATGTNSCDWKPIVNGKVTAGTYNLLVTAEKTGEENPKTLSLTVTVKVAPPKFIISDNAVPVPNETYTYYYSAEGVDVKFEAPGAAKVLYTIGGTEPVSGSDHLDVGDDGTTTAGIHLSNAGSETIKAVAADAENNLISEVITQTISIKKRAELKWSETTCEAQLNTEGNVFPTLSHAKGLNVNDIKYHSSNPSVATIDENSGAIKTLASGTTTITAEYKATNIPKEYADETAEYTLTVKDRYDSEYTYDFTTAGAYGMTPNSQNEPNITQIICGDVMLDFDDSEAKNSTQTYGNYSNALRVYTGGAFKISVPKGGHIESITFFTIDSKFSLDYCDGNSSEYTSMGTNLVWTAPANEDVSNVSFKATAQTRLKTIKVNYNMRKPATPMITSENTTDNTITVSCDPNFTLYYQEYAPKSSAQAPSRVDNLDGGWKIATDSKNSMTIDKSLKPGYGYSFKAVDETNSKESNELAFLINDNGTLTGVEEALTDSDENAPVEYYDLQGRRVLNPTTGLYIRRQGTKVEKLLLR